MSRKSKAPASLGRSLIRDRFGRSNKRTVDNDSMLHTTEIQDGYDWGRLNLQSVTEESSFQEFLRTAELAGTEFQAEKLNLNFINPKSNVGLLSKVEKLEIEQKHADKKSLLTVPRRPKWSQDTTAEELQAAENNSFLEWRRNLAMLQEKDGLLLTPYEKNLEFWRQLWRVLERSDVIVQIVDGRNPLLFRSEDLEKYVKELDENKLNMILINKADFLTEEQRITWAQYFNEQHVKIAFFSAHMAAEEAKSEKDDEENEELKEFVKLTQTLSLELSKTDRQLAEIEKHLGVLKNDPRILTRQELIDLFKTIHIGPKYTKDKTTIGLVGYPNVGKSSTINSLMIEKKVSVSATPGKTKHFQTLFLENDLVLCDCPGLVMPSFVLTKADMILNGILPIDQMRDHVPPVNLLCTQIPRHVLEDKYGIVIAKPLEGEDPDRCPHSEELLLAYGYNRGFMTANGQPDQSRSARYVLKDYVNGKLLFCYAPPNMKQEEFHKYAPRARRAVEEKDLPEVRQRALRINKAAGSGDVDKDFFKMYNSNANVKGKSNFPHVRPTGGNPELSQSNASINTVIVEKPWRKPKREKREKLRKKFAHLDTH